MIRAMWVCAVIALGLCGCARIQSNLFPPDPPPPPPPPPTPRCDPTVDTTIISPFFGEIPEGIGEDDVFNGALQFLVTAGARIDSQDPVAHTIVTGRVFGETIGSTCGINSYRVYVFRIAVVGQRAIVTMDCHGAMGRWWDPRVVERCDNGLISKGDSNLQRSIFDGAIDLVKLRRMGTQPPPPPNLFRPAVL